MAKRSNKKSSKKAVKLEFKERFLGRKMYGNIQGIELPKLYKDFTEEEKKVLYWHNPEKTKELFKDVSKVGPRQIIEEQPEEEIKEEIKEHEKQPEKENDSEQA